MVASPCRAGEPLGEPSGQPTPAVTFGAEAGSPAADGRQER
jgi:hypothetical protein